MPWYWIARKKIRARTLPVQSGNNNSLQPTLWELFGRSYNRSEQAIKRIGKGNQMDKQNKTICTN